jgi:hypothetical protein
MIACTVGSPDGRLFSGAAGVGAGIAVVAIGRVPPIAAGKRVILAAGANGVF